MASTITIQNTINWAKPYLKQQPLNVNNLEPALTAANIVLETMLGPPLRYRFNRASLSIPLTQGSTDYEIAVPNLGFIETQWLADSSGKIHQLNGAVSLPKESQQSRPKEISPQYDDNQGNITFRVKPAPDNGYTAYLDYQKKAPILTSWAQTWSPIPDEFGYCFNWGFLTVIGMLTNDSRFPVWEKYFLGRLLGLQDGLDDQARAIFLGQWAAISGTLTRSAGSVNSGVSGRGI